MTIQDSINVLILYFLKNDSLKFTDIDKLVPHEKIKDKDACIASLIGALSSPQMSELLQTVTPIPHDLESLYYILKEPIVFRKQRLEISGILALQISQIVNNFLDNESDKSSALQINENDIENLLNIIKLLSNDEEGLNKVE